MTNVEIEFFSPKTLAHRWSRSRQHVYDLIASGELKATPWGRMVQIHRSEVERYERKMLCPTDTSSDGTGEGTAPNSSLMAAEKGVLRLARIRRMQNASSETSTPSSNVPPSLVGT
jgi:excisionase family DNA binding protein